MFPPKSYQFHFLPRKLSNKGMNFSFPPLKLSNKRRKKYSKDLKQNILSLDYKTSRIVYEDRKINKNDIFFFKSFHVKL